MREDGARRAATDAEIARIARQLAAVIDRSAPEERAALGEFARDLLIEETEDAVQRAAAAESRRPRPLGPFAAAVLLLLVGGFFVVAFPPAGVVLLLIGVAAALWGVGQEMVRRRRPPAPGVEAPPSANGEGAAPPGASDAGRDAPPGARDGGGDAVH